MTQRDHIPYYTALSGGVWKGWWFDPDRDGKIVEHYFPEIRSIDLPETKDESVKRIRLEMVKHYGVDRVTGEVSSDDLS